MLESATVVAWGYVAEMRQLALAHAARPDDFPDDADDDTSPGPDAGPGPAPMQEAVTAEERGDFEPCAACFRAELGKQRRGSRNDAAARRVALSRCFGRGHILIQRTGAAPQVHGPAWQAALHSGAGTHRGPRCNGMAGIVAGPYDGPLSAGS